MVITQPAIAVTQTAAPHALPRTTSNGGTITSTKTAQLKNTRDSYGVFRETSVCSVSALARNLAASSGVRSIRFPSVKLLSYRESIIGRSLWLGQAAGSLTNLKLRDCCVLLAARR